MQAQKHALFVKSEPLSPAQEDELRSRMITPHQLNLLRFDVRAVLVEPETYDFILYNSPNAVQKLEWKADYLVVGEKTASKVQSLGNLVGHIKIFNNQNQLRDHLLAQPKKLRLLYVVGSLSEIDEELKSKHSLVVREGYSTEFNDRVDLSGIRFQDMDFVIYYSHSNYEFFRALQVQVKPQALHIFLGERCAQTSKEANCRVLPSPKFEAVLHALSQ